MGEFASESYATALAEVAKGNGTLETTTADVDKIHKVIDELTSKLLPHTANFLNIVIDTKRIQLVNEIVKELEFVDNILTNTELAVVTSVVKLESQHLAQIAKGVQKLAGAKNVRVKTMIDPSLVAGFTIRYGNFGSKLVDFVTVCDIPIVEIWL